MFRTLKVLLAIGWSAFACAAEVPKDFQPINSGREFLVDLRYASTNNFMKENLYGDFAQAYLHPIAFQKLVIAAREIQQSNPGWKLLIFDALRPRSVQRKMFERVQGTDQEKYVGNPDKGAMHNYGFAVDLSIADESGKEIDMGTAFDDFSILAQPRKEKEMLKAGKLSPAALKHRKILRSAMTKAGFIPLPIEWWHFDALPAKEVKSKYSIVE